ncbi:MAG: hypothetical protein O2779_03005 [Nanoarchaeota archaeon]|nr:hypothetical protein [Nanoarchaeota archaeon]
MKLITFLLMCILSILAISLIVLAHYTQDYTLMRFEVYDQGDDFFAKLGIKYQRSDFEHKPSGIEVIRHIQASSKEKRQNYLKDIQREEIVDDCIESITKNWKREIENELIIGYDEDEDYKLRSRLENRAHNGEKVCRNNVHS